LIGGIGLSRKASGKGKNKKEADSLAKKAAGSAGLNKTVKGTRNIVMAEKIALLIMLAIVALLLFVAPFYRGLFFPRELLVAQIAVFSLLVVWGYFRLIKREGRLIETPLDICLVVLLLAYIISFFIAVHSRTALEEVMKIASYLVIYLAVLDICRHWQPIFRKPGPDREESDPEESSGLPPGLNMVLHLLLAAATVITVASLGVAAGHWDFIGAYASRRIASPMGYANTAAAYLMAAYFLTIGLAPLARGAKKVLYLAPAALMLITVVLTFSRGAWLLFIPLALLAVAVSAPGHRVRSFLYLLATGLPAIPAALIADPVFRSSAPHLAWFVIVLAALLAVGFGLLAEYFLIQGRKLRIIFAASAAALLLAVFITVVIAPLLGPLHLERKAEERAEIQRLEQVIGNVKAGETYQLSIDILAEDNYPPGAIQPEYTWGLQVLAGLPRYRYEILLDHRGEATAGWENQVFTFVTVEDITRLEVHLYNEHPGTSLTARSVILSSGDKEQKLTFALNRMLPQRFYDRIFSYSRDRNLDRRLELFRDAFEVIKDYPLLGTGGGGWAAVYQSYQQQPYSSREIHNHYLQVWVEAGILGFLAFIGIWVSFAAAFIRNCLKAKTSPVRWQFWAASFLPAAALGAHSIIDWNFSMAAVGIFLFAFLAAGRSLDRVSWFGRLQESRRKSGEGSALTGIVGIMVGLFLLIYTIVLLQGLDTTWRSQELLDRNNIKQAVIEMEKAVRLDPLRAENYHNLSVLLEEQVIRTGNPADIQRMFQLAERAYELETFNPNYVLRYGNLLLSYVGIEEGLHYIDRLTELRPFQENSYFQSAWARFRLLEFNMESGSRIEAMRYLDEITEIKETALEKVGHSSSLSYLLGRSNYLLGNYLLARDYYLEVGKDDPFYEEAQRRLAELREEDKAP
jgi:O-antigen ligase